MSVLKDDLREILNSSNKKFTVV